MTMTLRVNEQQAAPTFLLASLGTLAVGALDDQAQIGVAVFVQGQGRGGGIGGRRDANAPDVALSQGLDEAGSIQAPHRFHFRALN